MNGGLNLQNYQKHAPLVVRHTGTHLDERTKNMTYFQIDRALFDHDLWNAEPFTRGQAWVDLIGKANHADNSIRIRGIDVSVCRGQTIRAEETLAKDWKWSRGKVRRFLKELERDVRITRKQYNRIGIITICNYDIFQAPQKQNSTTNSTTKRRQKDDKQYPNNKVNKVNNKPTNGFDLFWSAYPKKKSKGSAEKAFQKIKPDANLLESILESIKVQTNSQDWIKNGGQYIPHPATWLNAKGWEDEVSSPANPMSV